MQDLAVLPRVRFRSGSLVRGDGTLASREDTVVEMNRLLEERDHVLVWDLDGIERNRPRLDFLRRFDGDSIWVDAGTRTAESVIDVLVAGAEKAVIGTKTLRAPEDLKVARELSDEIAVQVDLGAAAAPGLRGWSEHRYLEWSTEAGLDTCLVVREDALPNVEVPAGPLDVYVGLAKHTDFAAMRRRRYAGAIVDASELGPWKT